MIKTQIKLVSDKFLNKTNLRSRKILHDGGPYHIGTSPLICRANQWEKQNQKDRLVIMFVTVQNFVNAGSKYAPFPNELCNNKIGHSTKNRQDQLPIKLITQHLKSFEFQFNM